MRIENEVGVIVYFAQNCKDFGYEIEAIGSMFPDAVIRRVSDNLLIRAEFEFGSKSFFTHQHDPRGCDLIICWTHNGLETVLPVVDLENGFPATIKFATETEKNLQYYKDSARRFARRLGESFEENTKRKRTTNYSSPKTPEREMVGYIGKIDELISLMENNPRMSKSALADEIGISRPTLYRYLGIIERRRAFSEQEKGIKTIKDSKIHYDC